MFKTRLKKLSVALSVLGLAFSGVAASQQAAQAASYGWVYISFPKWLGNCPNASVTGIQAYTDFWSTNWDFGDDLVYGKVALGQRNTIIANLFCKRPGGGFYQAVARTDVVPTRGGQTVWVGPAGWTRN
ncbi:hypothetical protein [Streptomyces sp. LUP30]|uniref:hypothetical protein n=1 Tax=Streptomyces sp. LUP30 TaxID=1890285 RepID=UPI000851E2F9|nr:hypothetical protein [Streptomyces sp. LUP30]